MNALAASRQARGGRVSAFNKIAHRAHTESIADKGAMHNRGR